MEELMLIDIRKKAIEARLTLLTEPQLQRLLRATNLANARQRILDGEFSLTPLDEPACVVSLWKK